jgi:hypothetical protein
VDQLVAWITSNSRMPVRGPLAARARSTRTYRALTGCWSVPPASLADPGVQWVPSVEVRIWYVSGNASVYCGVMREIKIFLPRSTLMLPLASSGAQMVATLPSA